MWASSAGGVAKKRDSGRISGCIWHVRIGAYSIYSVTLIGVFLGHFCINLHHTCTQYSNEGPQHWNSAKFPKKRYLNVEFCRRKTVVTFLCSVRSKFQGASKIYKWRHAHFGHALSWISTCRDRPTASGHQNTYRSPLTAIAMHRPCTFMTRSLDVTPKITEQRI